MKVEIYVGAWIDLNSLAGEKYVEGADVSLGGASMTPNPVEGTWGASLFNQNSIFHPHHPTSPYTNYLRTERLTRVSIGAEYGGVEYYWQRVIGYMDEPTFSSPDYKATLSGGDYLKRLRETELRTPNNYWGSSQLYNSIASDGVISAETYNEADAMTIVPNEINDIPVAWVRNNCTFASFANPRTGSAGTWCGRVTGQGPRPVSIKNLNVVAGVTGNSYQFKFWHRIVGGTGLIGIRLYIMQDAGTCFHAIYFPTDTWKEETFEFTARDNTAIQWWFRLAAVDCDLRLDDFS
ncbi:hypothetical protein KA005_60270, partial [bacterium]|nr:hypothetical protein [bacterium]